MPLVFDLSRVWKNVTLPERMPATPAGIVAAHDPSAGSSRA
jgi:hypothetical protein